MQKIKLLKRGYYPFYVTGIFNTDNENKSLITKEGLAFVKARYSILDRNGYGKTLYESIFGINSERAQELIKAAATDKWRLEPYQEEEITYLKDLIGCGGFCIIGIRPPKDGYPEHNYVECFLRKDHTHELSQFKLESQEYVSETAFAVDDEV